MSNVALGRNFTVGFTYNEDQGALVVQTKKISGDEVFNAVWFINVEEIEQVRTLEQITNQIEALFDQIDDKIAEAKRSK